MNVMAAICNSFSGRRSFASLTRSPGLNERAPVEEAEMSMINLNPTKLLKISQMSFALFFFCQFAEQYDL